MKKLLFSVLFLVTLSVISAQSTTKTGATPEASLLSTFVKGIKPSSFLPSWLPVKSQWLEKALKSGGATGLAGNIAALAGFIKPSLFKQGFNLKDLQKSAGLVKSLTDAAGLFKNLESNLKPEAMTDNWKDQRNGWLSALGQLK